MSGRLFVLLLFVLIVLGLLAGLPAAGAAEADLDHQVEIDGIAIELALDPLSPAAGAATLRQGDTVRLRLALRDTVSKSPLAGAWPAAWMDLLPAADDSSTTDRTACIDKVEEFIAGSLLHQAAVNFNVFYIVALNDDATLTVVDPVFGFGGTRLLALVQLASPGADWALLDSRERLFVAQPEAGQVAVVRTSDWTLERQIDLGSPDEPRRPHRLAVQGDGARLWVLDDGGVTVLDTETLAVVARVSTGEGAPGESAPGEGAPGEGAPGEIAWSGDQRFAFLTLPQAGAVAVLDARRPRLLRTIPTGAAPSALAWSTRAEALYVAHRDGAGVVAIAGPEHDIVRRIDVEPGITGLRFAPQGRFAFLLNPERNLLHVLDSARDRIVQSGPMAGGPDQVAFSDSLAYIRHRDSETVLMLPLETIGLPGEPFQAVDFPGGSAPFGAGRLPSPAAGMVRAPGANAMVVANPADEAIYYYVEGMAAPMGHFRNYGRQPRAVLVVDRSLEERRPGIYETTARLDWAGTYDLAVYLDAPRLVHCFRVQVEEDPARTAERPPAVRIRLLGSASERLGEDLALTVALEDAATGDPIPGVTDLTLLLFEPAGPRQHRALAREVGEGRYRARFPLEGPGARRLFAAIPSRQVPQNTVVATFALTRSSPVPGALQ